MGKNLFHIFAKTSNFLLMKNIQKLLPSLIIGLSVIITAIILAGS